MRAWPPGRRNGWTIASEGPEQESGRAAQPKHQAGRNATRPGPSPAAANPGRDSQAR